MSKTKIGINGFGRIGRIAFRIAMNNPEIEIVGINDLLDIDHLAYLLEYDSVHGKFDGDINIKDGNLVVNGQTIRVTAERNPEDLKWDDLNTDVVLDCTGIFKTIEKASMHITAGAKKVVISAPSPDAPMFVMGVNHMNATNKDTVVSNASCTTNCLAPLVKIINDEFGVVEGLMTTVHSITSTQYTVDSASRKNYRLGRSAISNIIPTSTGAALAVGKVIPEVDGKLTGMAFRVPTDNVSVVDLTVRTQKSTSFENLKKVIKKASENELKGIVGYTDEPVVSKDFVSEPRTSIFDADASIGLNDNFFKLVSWYDNEFGYSTKLVDLALHINSI